MANVLRVRGYSTETGEQKIKKSKKKRTGKLKEYEYPGGEEEEGFGRTRLRTGTNRLLLKKYS
jgi:hypothetical protein